MRKNLFMYLIILFGILNVSQIIVCAKSSDSKCCEDEIVTVEVISDNEATNPEVDLTVGYEQQDDFSDDYADDEESSSEVEVELLDDNVCNAFNSFNDYSFIVDGIKYKIIRANSVELVRCDTNKSGSVIIPYKIQNKGVNYNVISIGKEAFYGCSNIKLVVIPNGIGSIKDNAFTKCVSLESIYMPDSVACIGYGMFFGCKQLKSIKIPSGIKCLSGAMFRECENLESVELPFALTLIEREVFYDCKNLKSLELPNTLIVIGNLAFHGCTSLNLIKIPENVIVLYNDLFKNCNENLIVVMENSTAQGALMVRKLQRNFPELKIYWVNRDFNGEIISYLTKEEIDQAITEKFEENSTFNASYIYDGKEFIKNNTAYRIVDAKNHIIVAEYCDCLAIPNFITYCGLIFRVENPTIKN